MEVRKVTAAAAGASAGRGSALDCNACDRVKLRLLPLAGQFYIHTKLEEI